MANGVPLTKIRNLHAGLVLKRREEVLARQIAAILPAGTASLLDVGCGDGIIASTVGQLHTGLHVQGVEVLDREHCAISYALFDGTTLPFEDGAFDCVSFVDVLHHTENPGALVAEAARVSRRNVVIKDHVCSNMVDRKVLAFMDWVGNRAYGVHLNYNYLSKPEWDAIFRAAGLAEAARNQDLGLYPAPFKPLFENGKHFLALLEKPLAT